MRRISVVLASLNAGGAETRMLDVLKAIDQKQYKLDFIVLCMNVDQFYEHEILEHGGTIIKLHSPRQISIIKHVKELRSVFKKGHYAAVHANTSYHSGLIVFSAFLSQIKVRIVHARTTKLRNANFQGRISEVLGRALIWLFATDRLAISKESAKYLYGKKNKATIVPNAIDLEKFISVTEEERNQVKEQISIPKGSKIIGHVGRFDDAKNQAFLIRVFCELLTKRADAFLVLVGNGNTWEGCRDLARLLKVDNKIKFLGARKDIPILMNLFDVFVFPSKYEGLGNVVVEAQAAGTPCICSNNVPSSVDMGIGIVEFISLDRPLGEWALLTEKMMERNKVDRNLVQECFLRREYTLTKSIEILCAIYDKGKEYE